MKHLLMLSAILLPLAAGGLASATFTEDCTDVVAGVVRRCDYSDSFFAGRRGCGDERNVAYEGTTYYVDEPVTGGVAVDVGEWDESSGTTPYTSQMLWAGVGFGALDGDGVYGELGVFQSHCRLGDGAIANVYTVGFWSGAYASDSPDGDAWSDLLA